MISSLENLCRVPSLVEILNHPHLKKEIFCLSINRINYKERDVALQKAVSEFLKDFHNVLKLSTPKHLILFIGSEMWKWAKYQKKYFNLSFKFSENFIRSSFFTSKGLIDEEKAARKLLMEPSLNNFIKYSIACHYFLEDIIPSLWQPLQINERNFREMLKEHKSPIPMILWSNYLKKKNSSSAFTQTVITRRFKIDVFSYGLKDKNISAVKFSLGSKGGSRKDKFEAEIIRNRVYKRFCDYICPILKMLRDYWITIDSLLRTDILVDLNIILFFISLMNKRELNFFFQQLNFSFYIFRLFLLWPYENKFMDLACIVFEKFGDEEYKDILTEIIDLVNDQFVCQFYNYRQLFREFWIKSPPHLKKKIIKGETGENFYYGTKLFSSLFELNNFSKDDLVNINLILEYANSVDRENILLNQGNRIFQNLIFSRGNFKLADLFLKKLDVDHEILRTFKRDFTFTSFLEIMKKQSIDLFDKVFKWVVGSDDIDDFKEEILSRLTRSNKIEHFFLDLKEEIPFSFLNKIIRWFLKTDEQIEEWKNNIVYSPLVQYLNPEWFDQLIKYRGHSREEASVIKRELLLEKLPEIARPFLDYINVRAFLVLNLFYLCLYEKEKLEEFINHLRSFYENSIQRKLCLLCSTDNPVLGDGEESLLYCENHGTNGFVSLNEVERICFSILKQFNFLLRSQKWKIY